MPLPEKPDTPTPNLTGGPPLGFLPPPVPESSLAFLLLPACLKMPEPSSESCPRSGH